jgi:UrcA family protein
MCRSGTLHDGHSLIEQKQETDMRTWKTFGLIGIVTFAVCAAHTAAAQRLTGTGETRYVRTATVYAADLDLASVADMRALYERIRYAARALCTAEESPLDTLRAPRQRHCMEEAIDAAVDRANAPLLTAVHLEHGDPMVSL